MKQTPMLQQYLELKQQHRDALLLYRLGDFYELFFEDAETAAPVLGIVLTQRRHNDEVSGPMCGVPHHALASYVSKLLDAGYRVAIAEQVEDPAKAKGLVRRQVTRVLTPGTVTDPDLLAEGERRWVAAIVGLGGPGALAYLEVASGTFEGIAIASPVELRELLASLKPREVLLPETDGELETVWPPGVESPVVTRRPAAMFASARGEEALRRTLGVASLRAFELVPGEPLVAAAGAILEYLRATQGELPRHVRSFLRRHQGGELALDAASVRNLEILRDSAGSRRCSLAATLDETVTPMGSRLLRDWLVRPLLDAEAAGRRHEAVAALVDDAVLLAGLREKLRGMGDLERAAARLGLRQARPLELAGLRTALASLPELRSTVTDSSAALLASLARAVDPLDELRAALATSLAESPPAVPGPSTIRAGFDAELDEARQLAFGAKEVLGEVEARERASTGIATLRVRYNRVFGYAFEVSKGNLAKVPESWTRRQTLTGAERFVTAELEDLERRILGAEARAEERERELYAALLDRAAAHAAALAGTARAVASLDVLAAYAERARHHRYVRPALTPEARLRLVGARHPVVEELVRGQFVPNDVELDGESRQIVLVTGPNMGGKSTYLRQIALAVVMARAGSFVAADEAEVGAIDRVFTRVGAADDLARGESTFMVEMTEVANILRHATERSLVILDEVGRGTATFDGLSLAWAVVEALHDPPGGGRGPTVLFATHFHELTDLAERLPRVANVSVAVKEWQGNVLFLHRVVSGPSDRSYGIHVARLAGVPDEVCTRAGEVLRQLDRQEVRVLDAARPADAPRQLALFPAPEEVAVERLRRVRVDSLTPIDALNLLAELVRELQ
jgi:DNA mismatch repair protein MutS